jgi:HEPN domain-containing protein
MGKKSEEWLKQADYDMDTARFMSNGGRYFYAVFMCHLSIEKALKGLYQERLKEIPPKVHNLIYLLNKIGIKPPEEIGRFLIKLNEAHVVTRYPEDIEKLQRDYTQAITKDIITKSMEALEWIKKQF